MTDSMQISEYLERMEQIRTEIGKVMVGQRDVIEQMFWAIFSGGHVLLEGVPGLGKTLLVKTMAQAFELSFQRIQFTPDLMPADITGTTILYPDETGRQTFQFQPGPVFAHVVLADEINRTTPKTQSALLEAMQEHTVTVGGVTRPLPQPFFVLATQNPLEQEGTYPLPEAQLDRFLLKINVPFPSEQELREIVLRSTKPQQHSVETIATGQQISEIQQLAREILVSDELLSYAVSLLLATHPEQTDVPAVRQYVKTGAGPRGVQAIISTAKVRALLAGRYNLAYEDIEAVALPALRHRIVLNFEGEANGVDPDQIITELLDAMAAGKP